MVLKLSNFTFSAVFVIFIFFNLVCDTLAAPSVINNTAQSHDVGDGEDQIAIRNGRRRFILRRGSEESSRAPRKRHLPPSASPDPHFQPIQRGVPSEHLVPFLEFGQKLSSTSSNLIKDLKHSSTVSPFRSQYSRIIINIERPTSPNSIADSSPTPTPTNDVITISRSSTPETPSSTLVSSSSSHTIQVISIRPSTPSPISLISIRPSTSPPISLISIRPSTPSPISLISIRPSTPPPSSISQSDDAFNDIMANSHRRRRKKLVARRLQLNTTEVITDHVMNDTVMNAAIIRRKSLLQSPPQRSNSTQHQSVIRRPLVRITTTAQPTTVGGTTNRSTTVTPIIITTLSNHNKTRLATVLLRNPSITTPKSLLEDNNRNNLTGAVDDVKTSIPFNNNQTSINNDDSRQNNITIDPGTITTSSRVEISTSTVRSSTTIVPPRNNNIPVIINNTRYNLETTTRKTWRPISTMKPVDRHVTERSTTTTIIPLEVSSTTTPRPVKVTEGRMPSSETTFIAGDTRPSSDYTARPALGAPRDTEDEGPGISVATYALVSLALVTAVGVASYGARHLASRRRRMLDESELSSSESSSVGGATLKRPPSGGTGDDHLKSGQIPRVSQWPDKLNSTPVHPQWHFPRDQLRLQTVLGQGNFGQVWKAEADDICGLPGTRLVAVKSTKSGAGDRESADLLRELAIMQQLGAHPNVVTLLGCCTEQEPHLLIMEYVMYGKLLTFLRDHRTRRDCLHFSSSDDGGEQALTSRDLTHFAYCVAKGMDYLVSRGIIHRDLAARNVLVDHNKQCKIADFGMSRHARDSSGQVYEPKQKGALPIRWMAPESLVRSVFTHRSDVWSFGILMWEIVTLGSTPYPTMGAREVMRRVREGYRLERPPHCRPELFRVVANCWVADPLRRPDFAELRVELRRLRDEGAAWPGGGHVDLESALPPPSLTPNTAPPTAASPTSDSGGM